MYTVSTELLKIMTAQTWILYQTTNLVNGKIYVGVHKVANTKQSRIYLGSGGAIKKAIEKYGRESFVRTTLAEFSCAEEVYAAEAELVTIEFVKRLDTYNMRTGGMGGVGYIRSEETRAKISAANKGKVVSEETRKKIGNVSRGNKYSVGRVLSDETKAKISAKAKGRVVSEETRIKISAGGKGRVFSKETKAKLTGTENHKSLAIVINGKYYESINVAAKSEGVKGGTIRKRVLSTTSNFSDYRFATPEEKAAHSLEVSRQFI